MDALKTLRSEALPCIGRGVAQVMFQDNALSGLLILVGLLLSSWTAAVLAVAGCLVSTLTALALRYPCEDIRNGLYGFNGTLVGVAAGVFFPLTPLPLVLMVVGAALSTPLARLFARQRFLPGLTAPFVLLVWGILALSVAVFPELRLPAAELTPVSELNWWETFGFSFSQVYLQGVTPWTGLFFFAAIAVNSPLVALATLGAVLCSIPLGESLGNDYAIVTSGLMGYNAVLTAIALEKGFSDSGAWMVLGVSFSVLLQSVGLALGLTTLTAPFILSVWIVMIVQRLWLTACGWRRSRKAA